MIRSIGVVAACLAVLALATVPAHAAFPGGDGRIAFHTNRDGNFEIYTTSPTDPRYPETTRLTNNTAHDLSPAWSPDGTKIAFTSARDGNNEIYKMNADGTGQTRLTNNAVHDVAPAWSDDGTKIAFATNRDGNFEIYTMNADGMSQTRLTTNAALDSQPAWSPRGDEIAFATNRDGNFEIYTMNVDGSGQTNVTRYTLVDETEPAWAPWARDRSYPENLAWQQTSASGEQAIVFDSGIGGIGPGTEPSYSPGGCRYAIDTGPTSCPGLKRAFVWALNQGGGFDIWLNDQSGGDSQLAPSPAADQAPDWQPLPVTGYARPKSATPLRIPLVPAYSGRCSDRTPGAPEDTQHKGALNISGCSPDAESYYLTVGTPDFNGQAANAAGYVFMKAFCNGGASGETPPCLTTPGDQLDGSITVSQTDVRCQRLAVGCSGGALSDYDGNLLLEVSARITDKNGGGVSAGTFDDIPVLVSVACSANGDNTIGSTCAATTSFDAILGGASVITEQKRAIWQLDGFKVYDAGGDGVASTQDDNSLFLVGGLFFP